MDEAVAALVRSWMIKAQRDLEAAERLSVGRDPLLDVAIYHYQQAAEKALKGFLTLHGMPLQRTHSIQMLLELAQGLGANLPLDIEDAELLTPYATLYRYPGDASDPSDDELTRARTASTRICHAVFAELRRASGI